MIEIAIIQNIISRQSCTIGAKTLIRIVIKTKAAEPLEITLKYAVTEVGDSSYTSAVQRWKGTSESLNSIPVKKNTRAIICRKSPLICFVISSKYSVPQEPYRIDKPKKSKTLENKAVNMYLAPASAE